MRSRGADARAACTVALGSQDRTTNSFSLVFKWEKETDANVAGTRAAQPARMTARDRGTADAAILRWSTAVPTTPNSRGWASQRHTRATWCSTRVAWPGQGPEDRNPGQPALQHAATHTPSTIDDSTPAPLNSKYTMKYMDARATASTTAVRRRAVFHRRVQEQSRAPSAPSAAPNTTCSGADATDHAKLPGEGGGGGRGQVCGVAGGPGRGRAGQPASPPRPARTLGLA